MINRSALLKDLQGELPKIEKDILAYSESREDLTAHLQEEYEKAREAGRTAEHLVAWREAQITQAAVAWILSCVFVRFLEDNNLLAEPILAGPVENAQGEKRLAHAKERMVAYFNENPTHEEREYLFGQFEQLEKIPVIAELLDHRHNPLWLIPVSADGANHLIDFFQKIDAESGEIVHDFTDAEWDTRFLGDLYQDLSEAVRKRYALLQTPEFVESFILDYTLEKAKDTFGLAGLRLIDPTCGSGHFLLTTFERVFDYWVKREPATNSRVLAQRALDVVHGVDINPYAIAICRFRLLIAAMKAAGTYKVKDAPDFHFNLACGDSLLHGRRFEWQGQGLQADLIDEDPVKHVLEVEDKEKLLKILGQQYHVVVGNPPYIVVRDKALSKAYREKYPTCHRQYSLGVPFTERFFDLTISAHGNVSAGYVGLITANSFMKREFGKKLIEVFLPNKLLTHVVDTSGAYIPGHGTPTVILLARNEHPKGVDVRAVLGIRGEPSTPEDPSLGKVWSSIVDRLGGAPSENEFISVVNKERKTISTHPWSLGGGGATDLKELIEANASKKLDNIAKSPIGRAVRIAEEDVFIHSEVRRRRALGKDKEFRGFVVGEQVRDWGNDCDTSVWYPYIDGAERSLVLRSLWTWRTILANRKTFQGVMADAGYRWFDYMQHTASAYKTPLSITFAEISTHNHFVLNRGGNVFKQTAPIIKLADTADEYGYVSLLGVLNSSTSCFWMKQVFHNKGDSTDSNGARITGDPAFDTYQYASTGLKALPFPQGYEAAIYRYAKDLDMLASKYISLEPWHVLENVNDEMDVILDDARVEQDDIHRRMISIQEEIDWKVYYLFGLTEEELCYSDTLPNVGFGERAFEIVLATRLAEGTENSRWFERQGCAVTAEIPDQWPESYRQLVASRQIAIRKNPQINLIERPEFKRRWSRRAWGDRVRQGLKGWLLRHLEDMCTADAMQTCAQLTDRLRQGLCFQSTAKLYTGVAEFDVQLLVEELIEAEQVPQIAAHRLKLKALSKFKAWQETWDKQRQEDVIDSEFGVDRPLPEKDAEDPEKLGAYEKAKKQATARKAEVVGDIPVPPKYASSDFRKPSYWPLRGKLDVPKERFFSLPGCEKDGDATLVIGWAGMNHLQRAQAIASWYLDRKEGEGWEAEKLTPMLVAIDELIPWLKQWHNDIDPEFGERMGDYYEGFLQEELRQLNISRDELLSWEPPATLKKKRVAKKKKVTAVTDNEV